MTTPEAENGETADLRRRGRPEGVGRAAGQLRAAGRDRRRRAPDGAGRRRAPDGRRSWRRETQARRARSSRRCASRWIDFPGPPGTVAHLSLADVESGKFDAGGGARQGRADRRQRRVRPHDRRHPRRRRPATDMAGPEIRAASIATALAGFPLRDAPAWAVWVAIVVLALIPPLFALRWGPFVALFAGFVAAALYLVFAQLAFNNDRIVAIIPPLAAVVTSMVATASLVHGDRPAWLDRFLDFVSPSRGGNTRTRRLRALLLLIAAFGAVGDPAVPRGHGRAQARRPVHDRRPLRHPRRPGAAAGRRAGRVRRRHVRRSSSVQWPFPRRYHAKVDRRRSRPPGRARSPTTSSSPSRAESRPRRTSRTTTR